MPKPSFDDSNNQDIYNAMPTDVDNSANEEPNAAPSPQEAQTVEPQLPEPTETELNARPVAQNEPSMKPQLLPTQMNAVDDANMRKVDDQQFANDLQSGQIHPETMNDLFAKKSTLGKLGTIFGLMIGGAGAGLSHQPNALLEMMNNELNRDLDAQKTSAHNKQNWYSLALQHEQNMANVANTNAQTMATNMGTLLKGYETDFAKYKNNILGVAPTAASAQALNNSIMTYLQFQQNNVNRMPQGPMRDQAQAILTNVVQPYFAQKMNGNWDDYANKKHLVNSISPNPLPEVKDPTQDVMDEKRFQHGVLQGSLGNPDKNKAIDESTANQIQAEKAQLIKNRSIYDQYAKAWNELNNLKFAGQAPAGNILTSALGAIGSSIGSTAMGLAPGVGGTAGNAIGNAVSSGGAELRNLFERRRATIFEPLKAYLGSDVANAILPSWNDTDASRRSSGLQGMQYFKNLDQPLGQTMSRYNLKIPFDVIQGMEKLNLPEEEKEEEKKK